MRLAGLADAVLADPPLAQALSEAAGASQPTGELTGPEALRPFLAAGLARAGRPLLVVTATTREAEQLVAELGDLVDPTGVAYYPSWETLPHERLSPRSDTVGRRLAVLRRLCHPVSTGSTNGTQRGPVNVIVAPVRSMLQPQVKGLGDLTPVELEVGGTADLDEVVAGLIGAAYSRVDLVEKRGEFAVRGGIVDVFPPTEEHPLRVEFFGDEVEEIRSFAVADQRTIAAVERLWAPPCRELLLTDDVRARAAELGRKHPQLLEITDKIAQGMAVEGMEALIPVLVDELELLVDLLPANTQVLVLDPERARARAHDLVATSEEFLAASWATAAVGGQAPIDLQAASYQSLGDVRSHARGLGQSWWTFSPFGLDGDAEAEQAPLGAQSAPAYRGDVEKAFVDIARWHGEGQAVVVVHAGHGPAHRMVEALGERDVPARFVEDIGAGDALDSAVVTVTCGALGHGLVDDGRRLVVLTGEDIVGTKASMRDKGAMPVRRKKQIDPLELKAGDYVVHEQHGVGRFVEMKQREVHGAVREYLLLEYGPSKRGGPPDRLYVPADTLDQITRYVGGEQPSLDRLGGGDWTKRKNKARKAVREIAAELIKLYAARQATKGHAFGPDTPWQRELEDAFPFHETPDQLTTVDEVKADMQRTVPMDRLVCGDVGYGKTEIAVRAAFKAVQDGKQVAVLVPTTLLVSQHLATFSERMSGFPINLKPLSRFQTDKEAAAVMAGLTDGTVDVVVGTHRLFNADIRFKDLGLIIVDEEQRFGVEHKEAMKRLRTSVDVLSMSATPIPRTLEMAITGIREMSTITTPPEERHPVLTYVGGYEDRQVVAAVRRELLRDGQVFYIHNRVNSIEKAAAKLRELIPDARVATAHGQMGEHQLEQVMLDFWEKRFDVLVCTTIVESGLDVSNANTMIIERADTLGLSQLHQLRGRVGRSRERAYAYFLYPTEKPLTETAHERLATLAQHSDLGGGMAIAMKDLEIRGAGNLLGGEQSGHIADVGFDLYVRLVGEAVRDFRDDGGAPEVLEEVRIELPVEAHLPHDYIPSERLRLEMYKRLAEVRTDADVDEIIAELDDRYGEPPAQVTALLLVARFRARVRAAGIREISTVGKNVRFAPVVLPESRTIRLNRMFPKSIVKSQLETILVPRPGTPGQTGRPLEGIALLEWARLVIDSVIDPAV
ncbi:MULTISPECIES: transcription-repair coupling factor [unclassified Nocardioides]|uniref:transcription-repair coupling factor n=1 Tax=unclassified Nocardioides TaxID=2615069 RepID=UPI0006F69B82|nr:MULTISPECIES: transcription-repair coupling factor [unclassified Nocardioides]KRA38191.1 transcription-repair coupling factor [Nocardioides sp. Root614]KRA92151.1 transcription-repair coupling factor [Nocardioides sp. Root682]